MAISICSVHYVLILVYLVSTLVQFSAAGSEGDTPKELFDILNKTITQLNATVVVLKTEVAQLKRLVESQQSTIHLLVNKDEIKGKYSIILHF